MKITYKILLTLLTLSFTSVALAGGEGWNTNIDQATAKAVEEDKVLLLEFHGSDWCPPCIKLNNEVFSKDSFKAYAEENLVLVDLDFPRKKAQSEEQQAHNAALARKYGIQGFPTVILLKPDGTVIDSTVGFPKGGYDGFMEFLKKNIKS